MLRPYIVKFEHRITMLLVVPVAGAVAMLLILRELLTAYSYLQRTVMTPTQVHLAFAIAMLVLGVMTRHRTS